MIKNLNKAKKPWIRHTNKECKDLVNLIVTTYGKNFEESIFVLDGKNMKNDESLLYEFSVKLFFPSYFGNNFNALKDCLADLEWLDLDKYILIIKNSKAILPGDPEGLEVLKKIFNSVAEEWKKPTECWDEREAIPFHVIFQD